MCDSKSKYYKIVMCLFFIFLFFYHSLLFVFITLIPFFMPSVYVCEPSYVCLCV